jgi:hypothetical protein
MRKPSIAKTIAANRSRKTMPGMSAMSGMKIGKPAKAKMPSPDTMVPGGIAAMKKGGAAKKPKMGIAIVIAVGKKKGGK